MKEKEENPNEEGIRRKNKLGEEERGKAKTEKDKKKDKR